MTVADSHESDGKVAEGCSAVEGDELALGTGEFVSHNLQEA
jgi:hypothetical protein